MNNLGERIKQSIERIEAMQATLAARLKELEEETTMKLTNKSSMGYKVLDLTTDRGQRIYADIASYYPSLDYGIYAGAEYIYAEGYTHVIQEDEVVNIITGETVWEKEMEPMYSYNEETGQSTFNAHTCIDYLEGQCMLHNKPCKNKLACQDYFSKYSDPIDKDPWFIMLDGEEPFSTFEYDPDYSPLIDKDAYTM